MNFLQKPEESLARLHPKNTIDVLESESPSFIALAKNGGEALAKSIMVEMVHDLVSFFNIGKTMNAQQVIATVNLMMDSYSLLKPDDLMLCFQNGKLGKYGKVYDRMDGAIILEWLEMYLQGKAADVEEYRRNENKRIGKVSVMTPQEIEAYNASLDDPRLKIVPKPAYFTLPEKKVPQKASNEVSEEQKIFNGFIREFDREHLLNPVGTKGRFISYRDKIVNVEDYLRMRAEEI